MANPTHVAVAVLATDGLPEECNPSDIPGIAQIAADGFAATPSVITFVIGVGTEVAALNQIAQKGGSNNAFIVNTAMNVNMQFTTALNAIRGASLGCNYLIPVPSDGSDVDYTKVNVDYLRGRLDDYGDDSAGPRHPPLPRDGRRLVLRQPVDADADHHVPEHVHDALRRHDRQRRRRDGLQHDRPLVRAQCARNAPAEE